MNKMIILIVLSSFVLNACSNSIDDNDVKAACVTWRSMGCYEGRKTVDNKTCEHWQDEALKEGFSPHARCVTRSLTCKEARKCFE